MSDSRASGGTRDRDRGPGAFGAVNAWRAVPRLRVLVLFVAAADDEPFAGAARAMHRRAGTADKRLLIVRHGHGSTMLAYRDDGPKVTGPCDGSS